MNQKPQYSTILHNRIALLLLSSTVSWLYMGVIQVLTPPEITTILLAQAIFG